ncbi:SMP-30/gluconolactonase/LRE family protein [Archangium sp.]|uniref:SMP-30/gluconolactonase/LRE family protein n=1 Tax=Archangium sp. TaxID=1872627 RepID=UPI00389A8B58
MKVRSLLLLVALASPACAVRPAAQAPAPVTGDSLSRSEMEALSAVYLQAGEALGKGDLSAAASSLTRALELNPGDESLVYDIAATLAQAGRAEESLSWLEKLVAMHSNLVPQARDFPGLQGERYQRIVESLQRNTPAPRGTEAFTLSERDLIPEGIAHDPLTRTFFVSSIHKRKIVAVRPDGSPSDFATSEAQLDSVLGMRVDPARRILWANSYASPSMQGFNESLRGRSTLHAFDLATGRQVARFVRGPGGRHLLNDLAIRPDGDVFLTDSETGEVLKLCIHTLLTEPSFEVLVPPGQLFHPNGITLSDDGKTLFVADFVNGITVLRLDSDERFTLPHPRGVSTHGLDGLYFHQGGLVGVHNGNGPGRIVRYVLSDSLDRIVRMEVLESNHPSFDIPTTGVLVGDALYVIANSQLRGLGADGKYLPAEQLKPVSILRLSVARGN